MVNEREENYEGEEGEYQFSDDQINYDIEEEAKPAESAPLSAKQQMLNKLKPYRRMIIGVSVFVVILFIVYKMLAPNTTTPATEFNPNSAANPITQAPPATKQPVVPAMTSTPSIPNQNTAVISQPPSAIPSLPVIQQPPTTSPGQSAQFPSTAPTGSTQPMMNPPAQAAMMSAPTAQGLPTSPMGQQPAMQMPQQPQLQQPQQPPPQQSPQPQTMPMNAPPPVMAGQMPSPSPTQEMVPNDLSSKITALETQNANMMTVIQTQFAQKMTDYDLQNKALQERVQVLNKRLVNMEATLNKMAQVMRDGGIVKSNTTMSAPGRSSGEPKMIYSVQAIIPGRAWLKSESGETVTIAEGDLLKDYGRIVKIDPYDGVVQIDNGSRIITLSYGTGGN